MDEWISGSFILGKKPGKLYLSLATLLAADICIVGPEKGIQWHRKSELRMHADP